MKAFISPAWLPLVPHPCTLPFYSHLWKQVQFRELKLWWQLQWLQESGNNLTLEGAEFNACASGVVPGNLGRPGALHAGEELLRWESGDGALWCLLSMDKPSCQLPDPWPWALFQHSWGSLHLQIPSQPSLPQSAPSPLAEFLLRVSMFSAWGDGVF